MFQRPLAISVPSFLIVGFTIGVLSGLPIVSLENAKAVPLFLYGDVGVGEETDELDGGSKFNFFELLVPDERVGLTLQSTFRGRLHESLVDAKSAFALTHRERPPPLS